MPLGFSKKIAGSGRAVFFLALCAVLLNFTPWLEAGEEEPAFSELARTKAAQLFVQKKHQESLAEFERLEKEYPASGRIKRYIAALYQALGDWDRALLKLNEALNLHPEDLLARVMRGELYLKEADWERAARDFQSVAETDPEGVNGRKAAKRLQELERLKSAGSGPDSGARMNLQEFMKSEAARALGQGRLEEALEGFDALLLSYPQDVMIRRFRAITLLRLGRNEAAVRALEDALKMAPENVALHFYLAEALARKGELAKAREEYRWVIANTREGYGRKAKLALVRGIARGRAARRKPWSMNLMAGYDFDTNAVLKSNDSTIRVSGDQNTSRYDTFLGGTYRLGQKGRWIFTADGFYSQVLYQDFPHLNTYTAAAGVSALYAFRLMNRPAFWNLRQGGDFTLLKNKFYAASDALSVSLITFLHERLRTTASYRGSLHEYDSGGPEPDLTSRDGFENAVSVLNHWYWNETKSVYLISGYDFERDDTEGRNYIKNAHGGRLGIHFPLPAGIEQEVLFRFKDSNYNQYASSPPKRRDDQFILTVLIFKPLTEHLRLEGFYTFEDSRAKNNLYEYTRHISGTRIRFEA